MKILRPLPAPLHRIVLCAAALLFIACTASAATREFHYREQTGDESFLFLWQAQSTPDEVTVTVTQRQGEEVYTSVNTSEGTTLSWQYSKQPDTDVRVERKGDRLIFSGRFEGKTVSKEESVDKRPWYQPLSYSLHCMEKRQQSTASFWTIRPDNLEVLALKAEREGSGRLSEADGSALPANKVVIRLEGLMSALWSAEYWFRQGDNLFVRYRGTHGPPGVAETVITLVQP